MASELEGKSSTLLITGIATGSATVTISFPEDANHYSASTTLKIEVESIRVTMETANNGELSYAEYSSNSSNVFEVNYGESLTIVANPDNNYGLFYYEINGERTYNLTATDLDADVFIRLSNITDNITVTARFEKLINIHFSINGDNDSLTDKELLTGTTDLKHSQSMPFEFDKSSLRARVFGGDDIWLSLGGSTKGSEKHYAISSVMFGKTSLLANSTMTVELAGNVLSLADTIVAGETYMVTYTTKKVHKLETKENENATFKVTPSSPANQVVGEEDVFIVENETVTLEVTNVTSGYTFVGFKDTNGNVYYHNSKETIVYQENSTTGQYLYTATYTSEVATIELMVIANFNESISSDLDATTILEHVETELRYNLTNGELTSSIVGAVLQGEYKLITDSNVSVLIEITDSNGTTTIETNSTGIYEFEITETTTRVVILVGNRTSINTQQS